MGEFLETNRLPHTSQGLSNASLQDLGFKFRVRTQLCAIFGGLQET